MTNAWTRRSYSSSRKINNPRRSFSRHSLEALIELRRIAVDAKHFAVANGDDRQAVYYGVWADQYGEAITKRPSAPLPNSGGGE